MSKQDKRSKRAKLKAKQANNARARGKQLDAVGRSSYVATPEMIELFASLPPLDEQGDMPFVGDVYRWCDEEYGFDGDSAENEMLQVAALCVLYIHWRTSEGATSLNQNEMIEAAIRLSEENEAFKTHYQAARTLIVK
ncbi:hypothetical protein ACMGEE_03070 [Erwinia sp. DT-104]|mgnify:FL=1|uniref:Terminase n=2 Tax=Erwinia TaxID=551 RepID=A0ABV4E3L9_9GAMM|nr:hypothetical protein [Erwinia sp. BC051422]MDN8540385.1 hypothetical protein [Erwinia sp. BC051422]